MNIRYVILILSSLTVISSEPQIISAYFYSSINPSEGIQVDLSNPTHVAQTPFSNEKETYFYIHGWMEEVKPLFSSGQLLKYAIIQNHDVNIFLIDWTSVSKNVFYPFVAQKVENLGKQVGSLIWSMVENNGLNLKTTTLVGATMGAHIAGVAGQDLNGEVGQVVGLDPSGPWFSLSKVSNRLTKSSAKFVEIIHTCGGQWGFLDPLGHADYYPNGGKQQPMCGLRDRKCSQEKAFTFYVESILTGNFKAKRCHNYENFKKVVCIDGEESWMGGYNLDKRANGTYFLDTNKFLPFAKDFHVL